MRRLVLPLLVLAGLFAFSPLGSSLAADSYGVPNCSYGLAICTEVADSIGPNGAYTGHDEPSLLFYSNKSGSGNSNLYSLTLPKDPKQQPSQDGSGSTWNFQLHPAFWFGMAMCDTQSFPESTNTCPPDSDANIKDGTDPSSPNYIGKHAGAAYMEMQFYPPGWVGWPAGISCDATKWCAALTIDSLNEDGNTNQVNNGDCLNRVGLEPVSFAFITKSGVPHSAPDPLSVFSPPYPSLTPNPATDLFMGSGDKLTVDMHDTAAGFQVVIHDLTTHQNGSMTASVANGWKQVLYEPSSSACHEAAYAYHPIYATSSEHTRVPWAAHTYNVAFSDEIGHFEYCNASDEDGNCTDPGSEEGGTPDADDDLCFNADDSLLVQVGGCTDSDIDFDGSSYGLNWPGTLKSHGQDKALHPTSVEFTSPLYNGNKNYERVAFETDLPRIEAADFGGSCNRQTGAGCTNPPPGAAFYPIYTTAHGGGPGHGPGHGPGDGCFWQLGGTHIPGTSNTFGGNSTAEYGPLLFSFYPGPNPATRARTNNYHRTLNNNPCQA
ncbi:MAG: hypothetical protein ACXVRE_04010 [Gaiellaceae bacterium]